MNEKIGEGLVRIGVMTQNQVRNILKRQKSGDSRMFGEIAIVLGYIDDNAIANYLKQSK